jgi:hypothetical protein
LTDVVDLVSAAKEQGTFSILDAIKGRGYPSDSETVYTDVEAAYEVNRLEEQINDSKDSKEVDRLVAVQQEYKDRVKASALTFKMRGINEGVIDGIKKEAQGKFEDIWTGEGAQWCNDRYLAAHIVEVSDAEGNVDEHKWTGEEVEGLRFLLPRESFETLTTLMHKLTFAASYFDASVTPDFS